MIPINSVADPGCLSRIPDPDPDFLSIPDPRVKKAPDPESRIRVRNTAYKQRIQHVHETHHLTKFTSGFGCHDEPYIIRSLRRFIDINVFIVR